MLTSIVVAILDTNKIMQIAFVEEKSVLSASSSTFTWKSLCWICCYSSFEQLLLIVEKRQHLSPTTTTEKWCLWKSERNVVVRNLSQKHCHLQTMTLQILTHFSCLSLSKKSLYLSHVWDWAKSNDERSKTWQKSFMQKASVQTNGIFHNDTEEKNGA